VIAARGTVLAAALFSGVVALSLFATFLAARHTRTTDSFYNAGGHISGIVNGIAISAEFSSAASLLGVVALFFSFGGDSMIYFLSTVIGFAFVLFVMAERYRALGKFTMADVLMARFDAPALRIFAAVSTLVVVSLYLIGQLVSGAQLVNLMFGLDYVWSILVVAVLITVFVGMGGMLAITWIQLLKACVFIGGLTFLSIAILALFHFDAGRLLSSAAHAHMLGAAYMRPGAMLPDTGATLSLAAAMMFGIAGLPHILIRLCTVEDARAARTSMVVATLTVGLATICYLAVSLGAVALVAGDPTYTGPGGRPLGSANMIFLYLIDRLGGGVLLGLVSAAIYTTILAVVSGLVITAVSALAHDLIGRGGAAPGGNSIRLTRICTVVVVAISAALAMPFAKQNLGFIMSMAFAVSASANFPVLLLALRWDGLTARGALWGGVAGLLSSIVLVTLGPTVWRDVRGFSHAVFPYREPTLFTIPLAFVCAFLGSRFGRPRSSIVSEIHGSLAD